jgi:hypothetical protein
MRPVLVFHELLRMTRILVVAGIELLRLLGGGSTVVVGVRGLAIETIVLPGVYAVSFLLRR